MPPQFAMVPLEVCQDSRLTKMQLRVLVALLSFRNKNSDTLWPKRETLAERCGYSINNVSKVTSQLVDLGWLVKTGKGGFSKASQYRVTVPELDRVVPRETQSKADRVDGPITLSELDRVDSETTLSKPETVSKVDTVSKLDSNTLSGLDRGKEQTNEQTNNKYLGDYDFSAWPGLPSEQVWKDFKQLRRAKKAPVTQTVINQIGKQLALAQQNDISVEEFFSEWVASGYQGFETEWLLSRRARNGQHPRTSTARPQSAADRKREARERWERENGISEANP